MIDAEPYFYDPTSRWTGWKKDGQWVVSRWEDLVMDRQTVTWYPAIPSS
jgi:hypothetical protein